MPKSRISRTANSGILIQESKRNPSFGPRTASALSEIKSTPSGMQLLSDIEKCSSGGKRTITIADSGSKGPVYTRVPRRLPSTGTSVVVRWSPDQSACTDSQGRASRAGGSTNSYILLAHELVHGRYALSGDSFLDSGNRADPSTPSGQEEYRAIGLGSYANAPYSENSVRKEHSLPLRTTADPAAWAGSGSERSRSSSGGSSSGGSSSGGSSSGGSSSGGTSGARKASTSATRPQGGGGYSSKLRSR